MNSNACWECFIYSFVSLCSILKSYFILTEQQSGDMTAETTLALLQTAAAEADEESEVSLNYNTDLF